MLQKQQTSRNGALDGLRTLSIVGIILYHLNLQVLPSGHMGVVIFLVLSGYLATTTIVKRYDEEGTVRFGALLRAWARRFARILPSAVAVIVITGTLCSFFNAVLLTKMRPDVAPSLAFYLNWSYILRDVSYFDMIGGSSPLLHLWYLGVDMQFFLAWTLVLLIVLKAGKRFARFVALILAVASAAWMFWLYVPGGDPSRVYYGTDTRAFALLLGSWLALVFPLGKQPEILRGLLIKDLHSGRYETGRTRSTFWAHLLGLASCAGIIAAMIMIPANSDLWYRGGMVIFSIVTVILMATLLTPSTIVGFVLNLVPLRMLGQRAFALYLWHYPIFLLMGADKTTTAWWIRLAAVVVALVAAELSLRLFERPFTMRSAPREKDEAPSKTLIGVRTFSLVAIMACSCYTAYALDVTPEEFLVPAESLVSTGAAADSAMVVSHNKPTDSTASLGNTTATSNQQQEENKEDEVIVEKVEVTDTTVVHAPSSEVEKGLYDPVLIGDSVPGDAGNEFVSDGLGWEGRLPDSIIDTYIGRNPTQSLEVLKGYLDQNVVGKVVVMACFSNSTPFPDTLDAMIEAVGSDRSLYLVGTVNPDGFQDAANENLQAAADAHDNVHYVDWPAVLEGHLDEYLWADATHLRPEGARVYVDMVVRAIAQDIVDAGGTTTD